jgi:hypothetical protein
MALSAAEMAAASVPASVRAGTLVIDAGATAGVVNIVVNGDRADEPVEVFLIGFSNQRGAVLGGFYGLGLRVIIDND